MANLCKSAPISFAHTNPSVPRSTARDRAKRRKIECSHSVTYQGKCLLCKCAVDDDHGLPFGFLRPSLRLSHDYTDRMREVITRDALESKKLHLILDLDHTLLHTVRLSDLTPEEMERHNPEAERNGEGGPPGNGDVFLVGSETGLGFITKLRPFVRDFLREAHEMFQLTVYTMGGRLYASGMTKLLDPEGEYFSDRVIAREDCTLRGRKSLDVVLAKESNVLILDDTAAVWPDHAQNLMSVEPFYYFSHGCEKRGVRPSFGQEESKHSCVLATALQVLKGIHERYFDSMVELEGGDVREFVRQVQSQARDSSGGQALSRDTSDDQAPPGDA